MADIGATFKR